jgi:hypothetical protein
MPGQISAGETHTVDVVAVTDGDTLDVRFPDGSKEELRIVGLDTPETKRNRRFERVQEWEGVDDTNDLFRGAERPVWNNRGDTVIVTDPGGVEVLRTSY